jgi:hypothetical protein
MEPILAPLKQQMEVRQRGLKSFYFDFKTASFQDYNTFQIPSQLT